MKRLSNSYKELIKDLQRHKAQIDVAFGRPPRKTSKTYTEAYAYAYEEQQRLDTMTSQDNLF